MWYHSDITFVCLSHNHRISHWISYEISLTISYCISHGISYACTWEVLWDIDRDTVCTMHLPFSLRPTGLLLPPCATLRSLLPSFFAPQAYFFSFSQLTVNLRGNDRLRLHSQMFTSNPLLPILLFCLESAAAPPKFFLLKQYGMVGCVLSDM